MLNRPVKVPFSSSHPLYGGSSSSNAAEAKLDSSGCVHSVLVPAADPAVRDLLPINETDQQRLVNLSNPPVGSVEQSVPALDKDVFQMQQYIRFQQRLRQVERQLHSSLDHRAIFGATVVETAHLFEAKQVSLLQYDTVSQCWLPVAQYCQNQTLAWQPPLTITPTQFPHLTAQLSQGQPLQILADQRLPAPKPEPDTLTLDEIQQWLATWSGNWLLIPVKNSRPTTYFLNGSPVAAGSRLLSENNSDGTRGHWGIMALALPEPEAWVDGAIAAAQSIALELALALEQANQYQELVAANQELQKLALSDGLTSLANRRRFDEHLIDEWQRLARDQRPLSLILCDLDHFKRYNDTFGHPAGDRCLIRVARALLNGPQRPADLVARYGGEEFAIILPNTDTYGAWRIARKIHNNIRDLEIAHAPDSPEAYVTVTMGISTVIPSHSSTAQLLVQAADLALYHAKQHGRNRTYVHALYNTVDSVTLNADDVSQPQLILPPESSALS